MMNDKLIRQQLKSKMLAKYVADPQSRIVDELGLRHGAGRVDVAVINGLIHGYEIKGETDTLRRLCTQIETYNSVLDRVTLVVAENHFERAMDAIPNWWGVIKATKNEKRGLSLKLFRKERRNPSLVPLAIARLLWREEALEALSNIGITKGLKSKNRATIYKRLVDETTISQLRSIVRQQLVRRKNWRSVDPRKSNDG